MLYTIYGEFIAQTAGDVNTIFAATFTLLALYNFSKAAIHKYFTEIAVTNKRISAKFGFIRRETVEIPLLKIESVLIHQSILERITGSGSVAAHGTGLTMAPIRFIDSPVEFRNQLNQAIADTRKKFGTDKQYYGGVEQQ